MTESQQQAVERPIAAFVLSLLAGLFLLARSGMMYGGMHGMGHGGRGDWMGGWGPRAFTMGWPWLGSIAGVVLIASAVALYVRPQDRKTWGIVILVTSGLQLLFGMGGFIASVLGLVGGSLALLGARSLPQSGNRPQPH